MLELLMQVGTEAAVTVAMRKRRRLRRALQGALLVLVVILGLGDGGQ